MNTRTIFFLLSLSMTVASLPQELYGAKLKVVTNKVGNDNTQNEYPRLAPARYSSACIAVFYPCNGLLSILFNVDNPNIEIEIYKDGSLVASAQQSISMGDEIKFDISEYGSGSYEIIIMNADNEDVIGSFSY